MVSEMNERGAERQKVEEVNKNNGPIMRSTMGPIVTCANMLSRRWTIPTWRKMGVNRRQVSGRRQRVLRRITEEGR